MIQKLRRQALYDVAGCGKLYSIWVILVINWLCNYIGLEVCGAGIVIVISRTIQLVRGGTMNGVMDVLCTEYKPPIERFIELRTSRGESVEFVPITTGDNLFGVRVIEKQSIRGWTSANDDAF